MRYAIFSDIHSNLQAFEAVLTAYKQEKIDKYFCVGDIVGYGANPNECIELVKNLNCVIVAGNHDWSVIDLTDIKYFNPVAKEAVLWTKSVLKVEEKAFFKNLPLVFEEKDFCLVHGTLENPQEFNYLTDEYAARITFGLMKNSLLFVGHTHVPGIFIQDNQKISYSEVQEIKLTSQKSYIVNVGSVGQPRDSDPRSSFCIFDSDSNILQIKRINYDIEESQKRIINAGLPSYLADRLLIGH